MLFLSTERFDNQHKTSLLIFSSFMLTAKPCDKAKCGLSYYIFLLHKLFRYGFVIFLQEKRTTSYRPYIILSEKHTLYPNLFLFPHRTFHKEKEF